ncbi:glycoside hydrolase family 78 protein [Neobacillus drentensis]|uniref:family 78 glycoside hydrolase catalytic domain n=1 Tax=Neobacillus drentensis TaxID=220684 RepID=UPI001F3883F5|nr:family 78 glycoside hydrolase catalytic domain [Neobacillus drentensis]ULT58286.1 glycoside hydrolase family 78 protein [Neobacillus drentensis]
MRIKNLKTNRITNPLGFDLGRPRLSYVAYDTNAAKQTAAQIQVALDEEFTNSVFDSGKSTEIDSLAFELPITLESYTRYYWRVTVWADNGDEAVSNAAWFETAKLAEYWDAKWITPDFDKEIHPVLTKEFDLSKEVVSARAYVCGLGLYEMEINGVKAGDEYLTPNFNAYDKWLQYQTYDITNLVRVGQNSVEVSLGNGLYKGRFGFEGGENEIYGDQYAFLCEIVINHADGTTSKISSDDSWKARTSQILFSGIYDGEIFDANAKDATTYDVKELDLGYDRLKARLSLPVVIKEKLKPIEVIKTPAGETVLDMGQNMVGWVQFKTNATKGSEIVLQYGELLQEGNFYQDNLRTAKAEFRYISNGEESVVRPHFTFYGFRYVKVSGWSGELNKEDFTGCVLYSDMDQTGSIETSNPLVNKLFLNALWGQKGNFLDIPTDCPQRDERMGWTGDAQVFSGTAAFNMDTYAFFSKYGYDLAQEQSSQDGMVPMVVPMATVKGGGSSAWGEAATVIPWNVYLHYGDKAILEQQFDSMKGWVDFIKRADEASGSKRLWTSGFHFGDWLALDGEDPNSPMGGTETAFISSAYYCYSSMLVAKAAKVLGKEEVSEEYEQLSNEIRNAIRAEYFTSNGRLALNNQTALVVALFIDLVPDEHRKRLSNDLRERLKKDKNHLKTGFVGTPYLCRVLSENGNNDLAYTLLLNKDYPSWLYAVTMGATTIWERWNSVLPDGKISGTDMNSLNHYAYGSIVEWMYRNVAGINPVEKQPGFRHVRLAPQPDYRLKYAKATLDSAAGLYESHWELNENGKLTFKFVIPFNATATVELPDADVENVQMNGKSLSEAGVSASQNGKKVQVELHSGTWEFEYIPEVDYIKYYSTHMPLSELAANDEVKNVLAETVPHAAALPEEMITNLGHQSLRELSHMPFMPISAEVLDNLDSKLEKIKVVVQ